MNGFAPILMKCGECEEPLQSAYPGQFVSCPGHGNFVDQTQYYSRYGGDVEVDRDAMQEAWLKALETEVSEVAMIFINEALWATVAWQEEMEEQWGTEADDDDEC